AIETAVEFALPMFERRGIALTVRVPDGLRARANRDHLAQVLANLLQNAVRYTPAGGHVTIAAERVGEEAVVGVSNSGEGIPSADLPHVFERFYRVEKSRDRARRWHRRRRVDDRLDAFLVPTACLAETMTAV